MKLKKIINTQRQRRTWRVRKAVRGVRRASATERAANTQARGLPVDRREAGKTLVSVSSRDKSVRGQLKSGDNCEAAAAVGKLIAEKAKAAGISLACFDRGACKYHGRVAALANAAREAVCNFKQGLSCKK